MIKSFLSIYFTLTSISIFSQTRESPPGPVVIYGEIHSPFEYTKIEARLFENFLWHNTSQFEHSGYDIPLKKGTIAQINPNSFYFRWSSHDIKEPSYLSLKTDGHFLIRDFLVMPGDSIMLFFDDFNKSILFDGKSSRAFELQYTHKLERQTEKFRQGITINSPNAEELLDKQGFSFLVEEFGSQFGRQVSVIPYDRFYNLNSMKKKAAELTRHSAGTHILKQDPSTDLAFDIIKANNLGKQLYELYNLFRFDYALALQMQDENLLDSLTSFFRYDMPAPDEFSLRDEQVYYSSEFPAAIVEYGTILSKLDNINVKDWIGGTFDCHARDKIIAFYFLKHRQQITDPKSWLTDVISKVETPWVQEILGNYLTDIEASDKLAEFNFLDISGNKSKIRPMEENKILLLDFWFTGCGACVIFYRDILSKLEEEFGHNESIGFVSISTDRNPELWKKSIESGKYTSQDALNLYAGQDHEILKTFRISSYPNQLLIGPDMSVIQTSGFPNSLEGWREILNSTLRITDDQ